jgi:hypothetical protein
MVPGQLGSETIGQQDNSAVRQLGSDNWAVTGNLKNKFAIHWHRNTCRLIPLIELSPEIPLFFCSSWKIKTL